MMRVGEGGKPVGPASSFPDSVFEPSDIGGPELLGRLCALADGVEVDDLDDYVEAQAHGPVRFNRDVEALVLDPCFADTRIERAAARLGCPVRYHPGFRVSTATLHRAYRSPEFFALAQELGRVLTPDVIGRAARSGRYDLQALKRVWHYLARLGRRPRSGPDD